jgi:hypothetical protein
MGYENYNPIPDKILLPDGSVVSFLSAVILAPPDEKRARIYDTLSIIPAKFLLPDGSVVAGLPLVAVIDGSPEDGALVTSRNNGSLYYSMDIPTRMTSLEDRYVRALWFAQINSGTSGTITPPPNGTIVLDQWAAGIDAVVSTMAGGVPTFESAYTGSPATIITATMDAVGNWTISGTPSAYPVAVIYVYEVKLKYFDRTYSLIEENVSQATGPLNTPTFVSTYLTALTPSRSVFTDANKLLVSGSNTNAEVSSAVSLKHTQNTDQYLDFGGINQTTAASVASAVSLKHDRSHAIDSSSDHTIGSLTSTYLVKSNGTTLVPSTNTDTQVSSAVSLKHTQGTDTGLDTGGTNPVTAAQLVTLRDTTVPGKISHSLATAQYDFLTGTTGGGTFEKVTLAQTKAILSLAGNVPAPVTETDFISATGSPIAWVKKTLAETKALLGLSGTVPAPVAESDFIVATGSPITWAKSTLAAVKTLLNVNTDSTLTVANFKGTVSVSVPIQADTTLSGTPIILILKDQATNNTFYVKGYPTKV